MVARFQSIISTEIQAQIFEVSGKQRPDYIIACVGSGSNAAGSFFNFLEDPEVNLVEVEAAGKGLNSGYSAATTTLGKTGILHGCKTIIMQTDDGQIVEAHSISAGLDYPGIGPLHAYLYQTKRARFLSVTDNDALEAAFLLTKTEGIIPALESAHAIAALKLLPFKKDDVIVICVSGRGDKDIRAYITYADEKEHS
jgi:tryptophan synthase beta chain